MRELFDYLTSPEFRFGDFLVPWGMVISALGFLAAWAVSAVMERRGWSRHVWNFPLFFVALAIVFGCLTGLILAP
jgi:uncharacterized membrane protein YidH (DUF202 family)